MPRDGILRTMIELFETVVVDRPRAAVFDLVSRIDQLPLWLPGIRHAALLTPPPVGPGSAIRVAIDGPTGPVDAQGEVTEVRAPERLAFRTTKAPVDLDAALDLIERGAASTELRLQARLVLPGMLRFAEGMVRKRIDQERATLATDLKRTIEGAIPPG
jgi:uncharacterized protein YndB with AHSA1/START domain